MKKQEAADAPLEAGDVLQGREEFYHPPSPTLLRLVSQTFGIHKSQLVSSLEEVKSYWSHHERYPLKFEFLILDFVMGRE